MKTIELNFQRPDPFAQHAALLAECQVAGIDIKHVSTAATVIARRRNIPLLRAMRLVVDRAYAVAEAAITGRRRKGIA